MLPMFRPASRGVGVLRQIPTLSSLARPQRSASSDYGSKQSGMEQGIDQKTPSSDLEHPGPEPPSTGKGESKTQDTSSSQSEKGSQSTSQGGRPGPAIHSPKSAAETDDPDVKKHNEEMKNRYERTPNQLSEKDNKVDKGFWKGDVGPPKQG